MQHFEAAKGRSQEGLLPYIYICIYLLCDLTWQATSNPLARRFQPDSTQRSEKPWITVVVVSRLTYRKARFPPGCRWVRSHLEMR